MFLLNSRLTNICCNPARGGTGHIAKLTSSFFAEFLESSLPVCLSVLHQSTCVGYRYGFNTLSLKIFSWELKSSISPDITSGLYLLLAASYDTVYNLTPHIEGTEYQISSIFK